MTEVASGPTVLAAVPAATRVERPTRVWLVAHLALLAAAAVVLAYMNRDQWFFGDEWEFLVNRGLAGAQISLWLPHNEHWSTLPILVYTGLRNVAGLHSYWPFIAVLIAVHLALTHVLWRVMLRSGTVPAIATAAAAVFSVLGAGGENLLWAFQIGFVGAPLLGWAAALVAATPERRLGRRDLWAVLLLVASLMCSGIGVPMVVVAVVATWAVSRTLVRPLVVGGVPAVVFVVWYLLVGRAPKSAETQARSIGRIVELVRDGLGTMAESVLGTPMVLTAILLVALALWGLWSALRVVRGTQDGTARGLALAGGVGLVAFSLMIAFGRGSLGASRYAYVMVAMTLPVIALALTDAVRRRSAQAIAVTALVVVGAHNVVLLNRLSAYEASRESWTREVIVSAAALAESEPGVAGRPETTYDPDVTMASLRTFVERNGLPAVATDRGTLAVRLAVEVAVTADVTTTGSPVTVVSQDGMVPLEGSPSCLVRMPGTEPGGVTLESDGEQHSVLLRVGTGGAFDLILADGEAAPPPRYVVVDAGVVDRVSFTLPVGAPDLRIVPKTDDSAVCLSR